MKLYRLQIEDSFLIVSIVGVFKTPMHGLSRSKNKKRIRVKVVIGTERLPVGSEFFLGRKTHLGLKAI